MAKDKQLKAVGESNAARKGDHESKSVFDGETSDDPAKLGYSVFAFPDTGPAQSNSVIKNIGATWPIQRENLGTNEDAYEHQPFTVDAKKGK